MKVGVGLPTTLPGVKGDLLLSWARTADAGPFSSLAVLDRLVYTGYDPIVALSAAAAVTNRVKLASTIIVSLLHNTPVLAKMALSLNAVSGGRLVLGLAVGARTEDYQAAGVDYAARGSRFAQQLGDLRELWETLRPPDGSAQAGPPILVGGLSDSGYARMARYADGYVHGGGPPRAFARAAEKARAAWQDSGRPGKPQIWGQAYFALGEGAAEPGAAYLRDYYAFVGPFAEKIAAGLLTSRQDLAGFIRGYEEAGCDELVLFPTRVDMRELELLAEALLHIGVAA